MKIKHWAMPVGAFLFYGSMSAQIVDISPSPQKIEWGTKAFDRPVSFNIKGAEAADKDAVEALRHTFSQGRGVKLTIGERGDKAVAAVADKIPERHQGYYLKISPKEVIIAGNDETGTFYGVQTVLAAASSPEVMSVEIYDWPATPGRGVVEGFYGNAWSYDDRVSQFEFYGRNKLDTYIYGPKDDPYHRGKWRELYPAEEAARMKALNDEAKRNKVKFVWGIHPAGDHSWQDDDNIATVRKFEQMYDLGFRNFAIFFDDVFGTHADGKKHAEYMDYIMKNFVKKHFDVETLLMCPSLYNKKWEPRFQPTYLEDISVMDPFIQVMWTGNSVVDMINVEDMDWVNPRIGRKAFIWLNYPVTDYCIDHMLLGPFTGNDKEVAGMVSGFTANPMEYAEASKISLAGTADFLWNPIDYNAAEAWDKAIVDLVPDHAEAFRTFCLYNIDLGPNAHKLRRLNESPDLKSIIDRYEREMTGGYSAEGADAIEKEFRKIRNASAELLEASVDNKMLAEIRPWLKAGELLGRRGESAVEMYRALTSDDQEAFINAFVTYDRLTGEAAGIASRDFEGSIKVAYPKVGTLYAEPLLRRSVAAMTDMYKATNDYRLDVFPKLLLENGTYKIKAGNLILGNPDAGNGTSPVMQSMEDDVNPDRQNWRLVYNPEYDGYSIVNAKDGRYLNDMCEFVDGLFDPALHTFSIKPQDDGYVIINRSNGYLVYWEVKDDKVTRIYEPETQTVFQLVPVK